MVLNSSNSVSCPNCQAMCRIGELICPHCKRLLNMPGAVGSTQLLNAKDKVNAGDPNVKSRGMVFIESQKQITFEMQDRRVELPVASSVIIGRLEDDGQPSQADVGLNDFDAANCGVSRQHIKITRQNDMIYVTDLGSRNGTYLNHRQILPNTRHVLRNGDELRLGNLSFRVSF